MHTIFGRAAVRAVSLLREKSQQSPVDAWRMAISEISGSPSVQNKGCPRDAFLGLCEAGLVVGVEGGSFTRSEKNKAYALAAIDAIRRRPDLAKRPSALWAVVVGGDKRANGQMDVVIALWRSSLIRLQ